MGPSVSCPSLSELPKSYQFVIPVEKCIDAVTDFLWFELSEEF